MPILEAPPPVRVLYYHAESGSEISEKRYVAVTEVLAYAFQIRRYHEYGGNAPRQLTCGSSLDQSKHAYRGIHYCVDGESLYEEFP